MSNKNLTILGIAAVVVLGAAIMLSGTEKQAVREISEPVYIIQGLSPSAVQKIELVSGDEELTLTRSGGGFAVEQLGGYPARTTQINDLLTTCLDIKALETITDDAKNHEDLGVTEDKARTVVRFYKENDELLTGLVIGSSAEKGGSYVRQIGQDKVYLTQDNTWISSGKLSYVDAKILSLERDQIDSVRVSLADQSYVLTTDPNDNIVLKDVPDGKVPKEDQLSSVFTALSRVTFEDVFRTENNDLDLVFNNAYMCKLKNSTVYKIKLSQKHDDTYITCDAEFTDTAPVTKEQGVETEQELKKKEAKLLARDNAEEFSAKHSGWVYKIPSWKAENLTKPLGELVEQPQADTQDAAAEDTEAEPGSPGED